MANLYLSSGDKLSGLTFGGNVFGNSGSESVTYAAGVTGINVDQNVEQVNLAGVSSSYTFQQQGNNLVVFSGTTEVARIAVQTGAVDTENNGTRIAFSNGVVDAKFVPGTPPTITLGGTTVPAAAAGPVIPAVIDPTGGTGNSTIILTTGVDLVGPAAADAKLRTTSGDDLIVGVTTNDTDTTSTNVQTFAGLDDIDGGDGNDTLQVNNPAGVAFQLPAGVTVKNVENVSITNAGTTVDADVSKWQGLKNVTIDQRTDNNVLVTTKGNATTVSVAGGANVQVTDSATTDAVASVKVANATGNIQIDSDALTSLSLSGLQGNGGQTVVVNNAAAAGHTLALSLNAVGTATDAIDIVAENATSIALTSSTAASSNVTLVTDKATDLTFGGDKTISLALVDTAGDAAIVKTITSTNTAGVTITTQLDTGTAYTGSAGVDSVVVGATSKAINLGAGNDTVQVNTGLAAGGSLVGGDGKDTLSLSSNLAAALSTTDTFSKQVDGFEVIELGQTSQGTTDVVNLGNLDNINYVKTAGTAAAGTVFVKEVQTITITNPADADGGRLTYTLPNGESVLISVAPNATTSDVAAAIAALEADIIAKDADVESVTNVPGTDQVVVTFKDTADDVSQGVLANDPSGVALGAVTQSVQGSASVQEVQTITVGTAAQQTGSFTVAGVTVNVLVNDTTAAVALKIANALSAANFGGAGTTIGTGGTSVVTITYPAASGDVAQVAVNTASAETVFGAGNSPVAATTTPGGTGGTKEVQTFTINSAADADGGYLTVGTVRVEVGALATKDQIGAAIIAKSSDILAANANIETIGYNTVNSVVTVTYKATAGDVANLAVSSNDTTGITFSNVETTAGFYDPAQAAGALQLTNFANAGTVELNGSINGASSVALKDATGTTDSITIALNGASNIVNTKTLALAGIETVNITTNDLNPLFDPAAASELQIVDTAVTKIVISGNHGVDLTGSTFGTALVELDASGVAATGVTAANLTPAQIAAGIGAAGAVTFTASQTNKDFVAKTGNGDDFLNLSAIANVGTKVTTVTTGAGNDVVIGSLGKDTIDLGAGNDTVISSAGQDVITLGAGNDAYELTSATHSTINARQTITDFQANTVGQGTGGAATSAGAVALASARNGDVINIDGVTGQTTIRFSVLSNAADATTFVANGQLDGANNVNAALDSSTGNLYLDFNDDGVADSVIQLTGVTTLTSAAFVIA